MKQKDKGKNDQEQGNQGGKSNSDGSNKPKLNFNVYWVYGAMLLIILASTFLFGGSGAKTVRWSKFESEMLATQEVDRLIIVNKQKVEIYIKRDKLSASKYNEVSKHSIGSGINRGPNY